jgi:hypothetical protein
MVINTTRWSPDTCSCIIEYSWDTSVPESSRVHTISNIIQKCAAHSGTVDDNSHWNILMDENPRKNNALQSAIDRFPVVLSSTGAVGGSLKAGITFNFSLSGVAPNRVVTISFTGITLTTTQRNNIQAALDTRFGAGKVVIA